VEKEETVRIFGQLYEMQAEVVVLDAFSAHADEEGLVEYVKNCRESLKKVFIVHGESEQFETLRTNIKKLNLKVQVPNKNEVVFLSTRK